jgi:hypothetical protein
LTIDAPFDSSSTPSTLTNVSPSNNDDESYGAPKSPVLSTYSLTPQTTAPIQTTTIEETSAFEPASYSSPPMLDLLEPNQPNDAQQPYSERLILTSTEPSIIDSLPTIAPTTYHPSTSTFLAMKDDSNPSAVVVNGHSSPVEVIEALIDGNNPLEQKFEQKGDGMSQSINLKINVVVGDYPRPVEASIVHEQTTGVIWLLKPFWM